MKQAELDRKVEKLLRDDPIPFDELWMRLPMDVDKKELRESLLRLERMKKAQITYGRGWHKAKGDSK